MPGSTPDRTEFQAQLVSEGFGEIVVVEREPDGYLDRHAHAWEAKALILSGEITIDAGDGPCRYLPGQIFHLQRDTPHTERYGPQGVSFLAGRKY